MMDVDGKSAVSSAEAFAPTALMMTVETEEEAIAEANSRIGGLSTSVFTKSYERELRMAREVELVSLTEPYVLFLC
jgi:acyl-CoA reductase-like NAD-dependent aldehyde dehydrogenase